MSHLLSELFVLFNTPCPILPRYDSVYAGAQAKHSPVGGRGPLGRRLTDSSKAR